MNKERILNYPFFDKEKDKLFVRLSDGSRREIILLTLGGSHAYGTSTPDSDIDVRGIALRTKEEILLGKDFEQFTDTETDTVIYSMDKMLTLLSRCNPNTIEIIGVRPVDIFHITPPGQFLIDHYDMFLSRKIIHAFAGYANAQLHRLKNKSLHNINQSEQEKHILKSIQSASDAIRERYAQTDDQIRLYIDKAVNPDMETEIFMDVNLTHYPLRDYKDFWAEMNAIVKSYKKIGKRNNNAWHRKKIQKHCMHLIRLYYVLFDILEYRQINTYREKEKDFLLQIRNGFFFDGDLPKQELYTYIDKLERRLQYLKEYTSLPEQPDRERIETFLMQTNRNIILAD